MRYVTRIERFQLGQYPTVCVRSGLPATKMVPVQARRTTVWPLMLLPFSVIWFATGSGLLTPIIRASADTFDQPNVTKTPPTVNQPCLRTRFATKRGPIITDRHPRPRTSPLLGNTASDHHKRDGNVIAAG